VATAETFIILRHANSRLLLGEGGGVLLSDCPTYGDLALVEWFEWFYLRFLFA